MYLVMQTLGIIAAAVLVARLVPIEGSWNRYTFSCLVVASMMFVVLFFSEVDRGVRQMREERRTAGESIQPFCNGAPCRPFIHLTGTEATNEVGSRLGVNVGFVQWLKGQLQGHETYYLVMTSAQEAAAFPQWITYRLLPSLATGIEGQLGNGAIRPGSRTAATSADWIVFYGFDPRKWTTGRDLIRKRQVKVFAPGFSAVKLSA